MRHLLFLSVCTVVGGCVLEPTDDGTVASRLNEIDFVGYAAAAEAPLQIRSWNYDRGAWEPLRDFIGGTRRVGTDVSMYGWVSDDLLAGTRYWVPPGAPCGTGGMARFEVRERQGSSWYTLGTFDAAGKECLHDEIRDGTDFYEAGAACYTGSNVLLFAPSACVTVPAVDSTPPAVVLRATDDERAWEVRSGGIGVIDPFSIPPARPLRLRADAFDAQGPAGVQIDYELEVSCRTSTGATYTRRSLNRVYGEQPTPASSSVHGTMGAATDLTRASFQALCLTGDTLRTSSVFAVATGWSSDDHDAVTPALSFATTY